MNKNDCIFCKIVKGEIPSYKIYENEYVYAFLDIAKDAYGHTLVIPKNHYENVLEIDKTFTHIYQPILGSKEHFEPVEFFGGEESFKDVQQRDVEKKKLSEDNGVLLIYFYYYDELSDDFVSKKIEDALNKR